jgi:hypothetical protein
VPVWEMYHHIPFPMSNRVFNTLVIGSAYKDHAFLVVQIPVDLSNMAPSVLERSHQDLAKKKHRTRAADGRWKYDSPLACGKYVSVERVKSNGDNILWEMATASDAGGHIPRSVTNYALLGEIAKDVSYVTAWIDKQRKKT